MTTTTDDHYDTLISDLNAEIEELVGTIRQIYSIAGEDESVSDLCNEVLDQSRYQSLY